MLCRSRRTSRQSTCADLRVPAVLPEPDGEPRRHRLDRHEGERLSLVRGEHEHVVVAVGREHVAMLPGRMHGHHVRQPERGDAGVELREIRPGAAADHVETDPLPGGCRKRGHRLEREVDALHLEQLAHVGETERASPRVVVGLRWDAGEVDPVVEHLGVAAEAGPFDVTADRLAAAEDGRPEGPVHEREVLLAVVGEQRGDGLGVVVHEVQDRRGTERVGGDEQAEGADPGQVPEVDDLGGRFLDGGQQGLDVPRVVEVAAGEGRVPLARAEGAQELGIIHRRQPESPRDLGVAVVRAALGGEDGDAVAARAERLDRVVRGQLVAAADVRVVEVGDDQQPHRAPFPTASR
jgi:hypothetical protein